jgi:CheY-like chemotaxis protein
MDAVDPRSARVLIVEDEALVAADLSELLGGMGFVVTGCASDGEEAVALARQTRPALVLMDVRLPGPVDGVAAAGRIREEIGATIVYLTATADPATLARARPTEPAGYLLKPFDERGLSATLQMALSRHWRDQARSDVLDSLVLQLDRLAASVVVLDAALRVARCTATAAASIPGLAVGAELSHWLSEELEGDLEEALVMGEGPHTMPMPDGRRLAATPAHAGEDGLSGAVLVVLGATKSDVVVTTCAWCRRIRDEDGTWINPGEYIHRAFLRPVSHGMCPQCAQTWVGRP